MLSCYNPSNTYRYHMLSQLIKSHLIQKFGITVSSAMLLSSCANQLINSKDPNNLLKLHSKQEQLVTCPESQNKNFGLFSKISGMS